MLQEILDELNSAIVADPLAMALLFGYRIPCNNAMEEHPTVEVGRFPGGPRLLGAIGVINSVVRTALKGTPEEGASVCYTWDAENYRVTGFSAWRPAATDAGPTPAGMDVSEFFRAPTLETAKHDPTESLATGEHPA